MADVKETVNVLVDNLNKKINDLNELSKDVDGETLVKINEIKQKAITILKQVSSKIVDTAEYVNDEQEVLKSIEIVKSKSQELYNNAVDKINELVSKETTDEIKDEVEETFDDVRNDVKDFLNREDVTATIDSLKTSATNINQIAHNTLKNWLKTEDK